MVLPNPLMDALAARPPRNVEELARCRTSGRSGVRLYGRELLDVLARVG